MYCCPRLGPTLVSWLSATPATPAMPEPRPNVIASTHCVRTPMAFAMLRFCATARTLSPSEVFCSTICRITNTMIMNRITYRRL